MASLSNASSLLETSLVGSKQLIDDQLAQVFFFVNYVSLGQGVNVFGILSNLLSILVFVKLGFKETSNISLLGLTISDLCSLVTLFLFNLCQTPEFYNLELPFEPYDVAFLTVGWAHVGFARVTCCLTAFIILERCLCIVLPLKVKTILQPRRTALTVIIIFPISYASIFPIYCTASLVYSFSQFRNKTLLVMAYNDLRLEMESVSSVVNNIIPVSCFILIVVCTAITVYQLNKKSKWRALTSNISESRDRKLEKMVVLISAIFIVCYLPCEILFVWMLIDPELRFDGQQSNLFKVCVSILYLAETLNASTNIFVYYSLSSKYQKTVSALLGFRYLK
ncbi:neuropeptide receptor 15-like [Biomphalaria glabrata]|uniref:Neuropeptide receptor 15-like n=1 Tax=Biomphalaria glabrata TaxID=6526 RepID=A0A9U8EIX8_BIOGL|nr:neuropeptide receptor 15-like [Biomphalaria glabrata]